MSTQWFYIQQWAKRRWEYVGKEMTFTNAHSLFKTLNSDNDWRRKSISLALLQKGEKGMVITSKDQIKEEWKTVICNDTFLKDETLKTVRVEE